MVSFAFRLAIKNNHLAFGIKENALKK